MNVVAGEIGVEKHQRGGAGEVRADQSQTGRTLQGRDHGDGQDHHLRCPSAHQKRQTWQCCVYYTFQLKVETAIHNQKQRAAQNGGEVIKTLDKKSRYWFFIKKKNKKIMNICPICALHLYQVLGELQSLHGNDTCHWARSRSCRCQGSLSLYLSLCLHLYYQGWLLLFVIHCKSWLFHQSMMVWIVQVMFLDPMLKAGEVVEVTKPIPFFQIKII